MAITRRLKDANDVSELAIATTQLTGGSNGDIIVKAAGDWSAKSSTLHHLGFLQSSDPGAVGAGVRWVDTTSSPYVLKIRNAGDTAWETIGGGGGGGMSIGGAVSSGTAGSVLFVDGSGNLAQDNGNFFYDASGNQLKLTAGTATDVPLLVKLASAHSGNAFEVQPNASTTPVFNVAANGATSAHSFIAKSAALNCFEAYPGYYMGVGSGSLYFRTGGKYQFSLNDSSIACEIDDNATADNTRLLLWDVTSGTLKRVSRGASDSGGSGYRVLRISN